MARATKTRAVGRCSGQAGHRFTAATSLRDGTGYGQGCLQPPDTIACLLEERDTCALGHPASSPGSMVLVRGAISWWPSSSVPPAGPQGMCPPAYGMAEELSSGPIYRASA